MSYTFYIGTENLKNCLAELDKKKKGVRAKVRNAIRRGGTRIKQEAKKNVPHKSGTLRKSIIKKNYKMTTHVLCSTGNGRKGYHAHLVEYGHKGKTIEAEPPDSKLTKKGEPYKKCALRIPRLTKTGRISKKGAFLRRKANPGPAKPHPFMRPALKSQEPSIIEDIKKSTQEAIK